MTDKPVPSLEELKAILSPEMISQLGLQRKSTGRKKTSGELVVPENLNVPEEITKKEAKLLDAVLNPDKVKKKKEYTPEQMEAFRERGRKLAQYRKEQLELAKRIEQKDKTGGLNDPVKPTKVVKILKKGNGKKGLPKLNKKRDDYPANPEKREEPEPESDEENTETATETETDEEIVKARRKVQKKKEVLEEIDRQISRLPQPMTTGRYSKYLSNW